MNSDKENSTIEPVIPLTPSPLVARTMIVAGIIIMLLPVINFWVDRYYEHEMQWRSVPYWMLVPADDGGENVIRAILDRDAMD